MEIDERRGWGGYQRVRGITSEGDKGTRMDGGGI